MADVAPNQPIETAPANPAEEAVLKTPVPDATADEAALDAKINEIASGVMGGVVNDPRYAQAGGSDEPTDPTGTGSEAPGAGAAGAEDKGGEAATGSEAATAVAPIVAPAATPVAAPPAPAEPVRPVEPAPAPVAKDYSLTVKDAAGKEYKVNSIDELPEDFVPTNNRQVMEILRSFDKLEAQKAQDETAAAAEKTAADAKAAEQAQLSAWDAEIVALQQAKLLEVPKAKPGEPAYQQDPAFLKVSAIFDYMLKVNAERQAAGNPNRLTSVADTLEKMELADMRAAKAKAEAEEAETAKLKAGVAVSSPARGGGNAPAAGVYVAGQAAGEIGNMLK